MECWNIGILGLFGIASIKNINFDNSIILGLLYQMVMAVIFAEGSQPLETFKMF
jgi:hypothetical protein